jgi:hypothetical protein
VKRQLRSCWPGLRFPWTTSSATRNPSLLENWAVGLQDHGPLPVPNSQFLLSKFLLFSAASDCRMSAFQRVSFVLKERKLISAFQRVSFVLKERKLISACQHVSFSAFSL